MVAYLNLKYLLWRFDKLDCIFSRMN